MTLSASPEPIPLSTDASGVVLVSGTRVPLGTVVDTFNSGASSEEIALSYPSLDLADVYASIAIHISIELS